MNKDQPVLIAGLHSAADATKYYMDLNLREIMVELAEYRSALRFYATREHWMTVSEGATARTLFVAGSKALTLDGFAAAEHVLSKYVIREVGDV